MKDLPHHMEKTNHKVIHSSKQEQAHQKLPEVPNWPETEKQMKKKEKIRLKRRGDKRNVHKLTPDEQNKKMNERVPDYGRITTKKSIATTHPGRKNP